MTKGEGDGGEHQQRTDGGERRGMFAENDGSANCGDDGLE
jgi:hypothetical protein